MSMSVRQLAELAGVSTAAARRAIHGQDGVSEETRDRILALARKHHVPLPADTATDNSGRLNAVLSLLGTDCAENRSEQGFYSRMLAGAKQGAKDRGVEVANIEWEWSRERDWPLLAARRQVDGVLLSLSDELSSNAPLPPPVPAVFLFSGPVDADLVTVGNFDAGYCLGEHLAQFGHRRLAYVGPKTTMSLKRLAGLRLAIESAGGVMLPEYTVVEEGLGSREMTAQFVDELCDGTYCPSDGCVKPAPAKKPGRKGRRKDPGFTALVAYNDHMAAAAVMGMRNRGLRVPEDVSVAGFDDVRPPWYEGPALTTMALPLEQMGIEAVQQLYFRLAHPAAPPVRMSLAASLVAGKSTRALKAG